MQNTFLFRPAAIHSTAMLAAIAAGATLASGAHARDGEAGRMIFRKCAACQQTGEGAQDRTGPLLAENNRRVGGAGPGHGLSARARAPAAEAHIWRRAGAIARLANPAHTLRDVISWLSGLFSGDTPGGRTLADARGICAMNGTQETLVFAAESSDGSHMTSPLKPGEWFCISSEGDGTVGAFPSEDAREGCERPARKDQPEILLEYNDFDSCLWESRKP